MCIKSEAPNWVKDLYEELTRKMGMEAERAIQELKRSPFFQEEWVDYQPEKNEELVDYQPEKIVNS